MWELKRLLYQTIRVDASGREGSHCSVGERRSVIEEILMGVIARHRRTLT